MPKNEKVGSLHAPAIKMYTCYRVEARVEAVGLSLSY